jgi:hypothetical protein
MHIWKCHDETPLYTLIYGNKNDIKKDWVVSSLGNKESCDERENLGLKEGEI